MKARIFASSLAAAMLVTAPVAAHAADPERTSGPVAEENDFVKKGNLVWLLLLLAAIAAIILASDGDSSGVSP